MYVSYTDTDFTSESLGFETQLKLSVFSLWKWAVSYMYTYNFHIHRYSLYTCHMSTSSIKDFKSERLRDICRYRRSSWWSSFQFWCLSRIRPTTRRSSARSPGACPRRAFPTWCACVSPLVLQSMCNNPFQGTQQMLQRVFLQTVSAINMFTKPNGESDVSLAT